MHYIRHFLKGCQICKLHIVGTTPKRQFENRINFSYTSVSKLSCDIKDMHRPSTGHEFILLVTDEVKNYLATIHLYGEISLKVGEALINHVFCKHGPLLI